MEKRAAMLRGLRQHLQDPVPPVLVGDFNCVINQIDTEDQAFVSNRKYSQELFEIVRDFLYIDAFRVLFPVKVQYSWHCRGKSSFRLDRLYLPPLLESHPRVVLYIPTVSDHHALLVRLETAGIGFIPVGPSPPSGSFYWKLNSSILRDPAFSPAFKSYWLPVAASQPTTAALIPDWWEQIAKPAIVAFCRFFSALLAAKRCQSRRFFTSALAAALAAKDWPAVEVCRRQIRDLQ